MTSPKAQPVVIMRDPIAVNRKQAAAMLGIGPDVLKRARDAGRIRAKNTSVDADGIPRGLELYDVAELRRWFDSLDDV